ncbi:caspase-9 isoform X3 [Sceloporus undulatus]|uniref:caspase-9 isoform X3 n=1 Tax=Sceloporus undulatus TaxID=8520 RepID=UPI001C4DB958|nr:caspase-9 isoform X3 [Sceloporus undulatus]
MEEAQRLVLRRSRLRLVRELRVEPLWEPLLRKGVFTRDMIQEIQASGTRRDQARQLVIDLESRGKQALPLFIGCLQETGQSSLAAFLAEGCCASQGPPADIKPIQVPSHSGQGDPTSESLPFPIQAMNQRHQEPTHDVSAAQGSVEERPRRNSETEIASELQSLARRDHGSLDCCLVVILSHGCQTSHIQFPGGIYGTDGRRLAVEKIVSYFNGSNSPSLRGKPKIFFIQACGGEEKDRGFQVDFDASPGGQMSGRTVESDATPFQVQMGNSDELDAIASLPTPSDILVSYSTFPGFVSWRDKLTGSWYVETLDQVLEQYASSEDLLDMLLRVADAVSAKGTFKQMPGCFNFLRKRFFFMVK